MDTLKVNQIYNLDCREGLKQLEDNSIDCVIASPPYWNLRDYEIKGVIWDDNFDCDHIWTDHLSFNWLREPIFCVKCGAWYGVLGLEPNFELYIKHLCNIYDDVKRVLKKSGTCWVNLGDSYGSGKHYDSKYLNNEEIQKKGPVKGYQKCLLLIPQRFAIEMINRGWILRNVIIWHKPNAMPSSAKDRFTVDFEYIYFFVKRKKYWFEQQRESLKESGWDQWSKKYNVGIGGKRDAPQKIQQNQEYIPINPLGRNKRTVWRIPTKPNPEAHFATFPPNLVKPMIKSGCPEYICKECGKPREKIIEKGKTYYQYCKDNKLKWSKDAKSSRDDNQFPWDTKLSGQAHKEFRDKNPDILKGYSDCGCEAKYKPGIVLDPFAGVGTTLKEAWKLGRNYIGFEISKEYCEIARKILDPTKNYRLTDFMKIRITDKLKEKIEEEYTI